MSLKIKLLLIFALIGLLFVGVAIRRSGDDNSTAALKKATTGPTSLSPRSAEKIAEPAERIAKTPTPPLLSNKVHIEAVSLEDISAELTPAEARDLHQRLSSELIAELKELAKVTDHSRINSRLKPTVQKFYYLNKAVSSGEEGFEKRLPESFQADVQVLEELWTNNPSLATAADDLFARFDLLNYEHIPYQLRNELVLQ